MAGFFQPFTQAVGIGIVRFTIAEEIGGDGDVAIFGKESGPIAGANAGLVDTGINKSPDHEDDRKAGRGGGGGGHIKLAGHGFTGSGVGKNVGGVVIRFDVFDFFFDDYLAGSGGGVLKIVEGVLEQGERFLGGGEIGGLGADEGAGFRRVCSIDQDCTGDDDGKGNGGKNSVVHGLRGLYLKIFE